MCVDTEGYKDRTRGSYKLSRLKKFIGEKIYCSNEKSLSHYSHYNNEKLNKKSKFCCYFNLM